MSTTLMLIQQQLSQQPLVSKTSNHKMRTIECMVCGIVALNVIEKELIIHDSVIMTSENSSSKVQRQTEGILVRLITHNIRYATTSPFKGEEKWEVRCPRLCAQLHFNSCNQPGTFICLQEALNKQLNNILDSLNSNGDLGASWDYLGVGRDDGKKAGEYNPIFYRSDVWDLEKQQTLWLSETPLVPSRGWDAACNRLVTIGGFKHHQTKQRVVVMSTHLDHQGIEARRMSAKILLAAIDKFGEDLPQSLLLLAGDFNSTPDDDAYKIMTTDSNMVDVSTAVSREKRYGNELTYTSFGYVDNTPSRIDYIFARRHKSARTSSYAVLANRFDDGVYISDHRACVADVWLAADEGSRNSVP